MKLTVVVKQKDTRCYKFDEGCCMCNDVEILKSRLICEEVDGHVIVMIKDGLEKEGFACNACLLKVEESSSITVER